MDVSMDCVVPGSLAVVLRVSKYVGIAPLHFMKKDNGWRIKLDRRWSVYGYLCITTIMVITIIPLIRNDIFTRMNMSIIVCSVCTCFTPLLAMTAAFSAPGRMRSIIVCLQNAQKINQKLNVDHKPMFPDRKKFLVFTFFMVIAFTMNCAQNLQLVLTMSNMGHATWVYVLPCINWWSLLITEMYKIQFIALTMHAMEIFKAVSDGLRGLLHATADQNTSLPLAFNKGSFKMSKKFKRNSDNVSCFPDFALTKLDGISDVPCPHHEVARRLARAYTAACDMVRELDKIHGPIMLSVLGLFLFQLVISSYSFISNLFYGHAAFNTRLVRGILTLSWFIYCAASLILVIEPCHLTLVEMETTQVLVSHLMGASHSTYDLLAMELELFFRILILNEASYSPLQVAKLSRPLILTILGSVTTYLVILLNS